MKTTFSEEAFLAAFDLNWGDELSCYGIKLYQNEEDYVRKFTLWYLECVLGVSYDNLASFIGFTTDEDKYFFSEEDIDELATFLEERKCSYLDEQKKRHYKAEDKDYCNLWLHSFQGESLQSCTKYDELIAAAIESLGEDCPRRVGISVGTNEYPEDNVLAWYEFFRDPDIILSGEATKELKFYGDHGGLVLF